MSITRRNALITIGGVATAWAMPSVLHASPELPPGVYLPSSDHLGHALMSSARFHPIPAGCPTDYIRPRTGPFTPLFFLPTEFTTVQRMTQLILGEPDTSETTQEVAEWIDLSVASAASVRNVAQHLNPLHRALAVAYFGSSRVTKLETADPEKICRDGFEWLAAASHSHGADRFLSLTQEQQIGVLDSMSGSEGNAGSRLFAFLKAEVVKGYYTSQAGLKELDFKGNAFYARSPGCDSRKI